MAGISAYEMLRNLQMHSHKLKYKSKYANRLVYVLMHNDNLCTAHYRQHRFEREGKYIDIAKSNDASLDLISKAIEFLLDFMDGGDSKESRRAECKFLSEASTKVWVKNLRTKLPELCRMTKEYVEGFIKESTNVPDAKDQEKEGIDYVKGLIVK